MASSNDAIMIGGYPLSGILQGAEYEVTRLAGWWNRPGVKRAGIPRERADGDFPTPWNFEPRYIGIDGWVTAKSHEQMHHIIDQLSGLCAVNREWLTIQGHGGTQSALVEADDAPYLYPETDMTLRFELRFKANDPRKTGRLYTEQIGPTQTVHSQVGNYPASPTIRVFPSNTPGGFVVNAFYNGQVRRWEYAAGGWSTQEHLIELETGKHFVNGIEVPDRLGPAQLWDIPPGTQVAVRLFPNNTSERLRGELTYRDTYI